MESPALIQATLCARAADVMTDDVHLNIMLGDADEASRCAKSALRERRRAIDWA
jgi:hypothetical protein